MERDMSNTEIKSKKFLKLQEEAIRQANLEVINPMVPALSIDKILPVAVNVAKLRGRYIAAMFDLLGEDSTGTLDDNQTESLRVFRLAYEESLAAYRTMEHAIDRGYLTLETS